MQVGGLVLRKLGAPILGYRQPMTHVSRTIVDYAPTQTESHPIWKVRSVRFPYQHLRLQPFLESGLAERTLHWLTTTDAWRRDLGHFYCHETFALAPSILPPDVGAIVSSALLSALRQVLQFELSTALDGFAWIEAHRSLVRDRLGVHTDEDANEVRLTLTLGKSAVLRGGILTLRDDPYFPAKQIEYFPVHNSATAFRTSANTYHCVSRVDQGARYALVYRFPLLKNTGVPNGRPAQLNSELPNGTVISALGTSAHPWSAYRSLSFLTLWQNDEPQEHPRTASFANSKSSDHTILRTHCTRDYIFHI